MRRFPTACRSIPRNPFHDADLLARGIGIRFNGEERTTVEEYCVSEGWIRVAAGKALDRRGRPMTVKIKGEVVPYFLDAGADPHPPQPPDPRVHIPAAPGAHLPVDARV